MSISNPSAKSIVIIGNSRWISAAVTTVKTGRLNLNLEVKFHTVITDCGVSSLLVCETLHVYLVTVLHSGYTKDVHLCMQVPVQYFRQTVQSLFMGSANTRLISHDMKCLANKQYAICMIIYKAHIGTSYRVPY